MDNIMDRKGLETIYEATMCGGAACCGDIDGALDAAKNTALAILDDLTAGLITTDEARSRIEVLQVHPQATPLDLLESRGVVLTANG